MIVIFNTADVAVVVDVDVIVNVIGPFLICGSAALCPLWFKKDVTTKDTAGTKGAERANCATATLQLLVEFDVHGLSLLLRLIPSGD